LAYFQGEKQKDKLALHKQYCNKQSVPQPAQYTYPEKGEVLKFKKMNMTLPIEYVAYADFEVMLVPINEEDQEHGKSTKQTHKHVPIGFSYYIVGPNNIPFSQPESFVGINAAEEFMKRIKQHALSIKELYNAFPKPPSLSKEEWKSFNKKKYCCICLNPFKLFEKRVRHHSHVTGELIGPAHSDCNIQCRVPNYLPVFFHNLSKYDGHIISLVTGADGDVTVLPNTEETYITIKQEITGKDGFKKGCFFLKFIDTYRFLSTSLRHLVEILPESELKHTKIQYPDQDQFKFAKSKNYFPYEYLDSIDKLKDKELPGHQLFFSSLDDTNITEDEYKFAQEAWNTFNCETLEDYLRTYCKIDVLLLADCFQTFRSECIKNYQMDPAYCVSLPGFTFEAFLKKSRVELELLYNSDLYQFFEYSIKGGITSAVRRHCKANTTRIPETYDKTKPPTSMLYIDANNLYGYAMSQMLPEKNFKFEDDVDKFSSDFIMNLQDDASTGYFLEVDFNYPKELHDKHNDLPLCCEKKSVGGSSTVKKLVCSLEDKKHQILHYRMVKFCIQQGLQLVKVHRVVSFHQSKFLEEYIRTNTILRQGATNSFSKDLFKLMNNACYGKFIENQRNRIMFDLCAKEEKVEKLIRSPFFKKSVIFTEDLVGIHRFKKQQCLDRPIYVGASILELARLHMYKFYYEQLPIIFPDAKYGLCYMDTDSFILYIEKDDITDNIIKNSQFFDCSCYNKNSSLYSDTNCRVPGKFKDELNDAILQELIVLSCKVYAIKKFPEGKVAKRTKGCKKNVRDKQITWEDFEACLKNADHIVKRSQKTFRSKKHVLFTVEQNKVVLRKYDDKRVWLPPDYNTSLAIGHKDITTMETE